MLIGEDAYGNVVCDGGRELSEPDRAELERFAAMLTAVYGMGPGEASMRASDLTTRLRREEAHELVYGVEAPSADKEA